MTLHCIANASMIVMTSSPATRIMKQLAVHSPHQGKSGSTDQPAPRQRSHPDTVPKLQAISHGAMMVTDYGPQTARLETAHFIPASPHT